MRRYIIVFFSIRIHINNSYRYENIINQHFGLLNCRPDVFFNARQMCIKIRSSLRNNYVGVKMC